MKRTGSCRIFLIIIVFGDVVIVIIVISTFVLLRMVVANFSIVIVNICSCIFRRFYYHFPSSSSRHENIKTLLRFLRLTLLSPTPTPNPSERRLS